MVINPARIDRKKTAMGAESSFSLTRQAQTHHYDRRIVLSQNDLRTSAWGLARTYIGADGRAPWHCRAHGLTPRSAPADTPRGLDPTPHEFLAPAR
jgi:hypothetical protein